MKESVIMKKALKTSAAALIIGSSLLVALPAQAFWGPFDWFDDDDWYGPYGPYGYPDYWGGHPGYWGGYPGHWGGYPGHWGGYPGYYGYPGHYGYPGYGYGYPYAYPYGAPAAPATTNPPKSE
jgi:hypothetical protein